MKKVSLIYFVMAFLFGFAAFCFAGDYGTVGDKVFEPLAKLFGADTAGKLLAALVAVIGWIISRVILKKVPVSMQGIIGKVFWSIAKGLFGDGVVLANHTNPEYLKAELKKKYPLLQIDIKKLGGDK